MADVFISYVHTDTAIAERVSKYLKKAGISVWRDHDKLVGGSNWAVNIQEALESAANGLLLLSRSSVNSAYVAREYQYFLAKKNGFILRSSNTFLLRKFLFILHNFSTPI